jgi:hypothetical protein
MTTPEQLAENTAVYLLPHPRYPRVVTEDYTYVAGPHDAWVLDVRTPNIEWARAETRRRGLPVVEWWVGWSASPELADELLAHGLVPGDEPVLTGMSSSAEPPPAPHVDVRPVETEEQYLEVSRSTGRFGRFRRTSARNGARAQLSISAMTAQPAWRITGRPTTQIVRSGSAAVSTWRPASR